MFFLDSVQDQTGDDLHKNKEKLIMNQTVCSNGQLIYFIKIYTMIIK